MIDYGSGPGRADHSPPPRSTASTSDAEPLAFGLLLDMTDYHVHAVYDPADYCPLAACGRHLVPGIWIPGPVLLCRGCLAALPDPAGVEPRAASAVRRRVMAADPDDMAGPALAACRWYLARRYDRRIRRAVAAEWRRG